MSTSLHVWIARGAVLSFCALLLFVFVIKDGELPSLEGEVSVREKAAHAFRAPTMPKAGEKPERPKIARGASSIVTVTLRTADQESAWTDAPVGVCLGEGLCWPLDLPGVNAQERGEVDVFHFEVTSQQARTLDRVLLYALPSAKEADRQQSWSPACVDLRLDGAPLYCNDSIKARIGLGQGAEARWRDPDGLAQRCRSCWEAGGAGAGLTHGPMLGAVDHESLRVWARLDATRPVGLRLGISPDLKGAPIVAWGWPRAEDDFTTTLIARGLEPRAQYYYRLEVDGAAIGPARPVRTGPEPGAKVPVRLAFGSCTSSAEQPIFEPIRASEPDLFLFLGDVHYANSSEREVLRWHYRKARSIKPRASLLAVTPTLMTWDDHDYLGDNTNATCLGGEASFDVLQEYWANPSYGQQEAPGVYFHTSLGDVDLFVLDCRTYRPDIGDESKRCAVNPNATRLPIEDGPLGKLQERWLMQGLASSKATFKLIACGSRLSPKAKRDSWSAFDVARERLLTGIARAGIEGVVYLTGDIHRSLIASVKSKGSYDLPELVSSPLASQTFWCGPIETYTQQCYGGGPSWMQLDIDPSALDPTLTVQILNEQGQPVREAVIKRSTLQ